MNVGALYRTATAVGCAAFAVGGALAEQPVPLSGYNADISESSVSGVSAGGFMAVQIGTAWSSVIKGVGIVAGGPYWCAKADAWDIFDGYWLPFWNATGLCMSGQPLSDLSRFIAKADAKSASGDIDSLQFVSRQKVYLFHGYNDSKVAKSVTAATAEFYRHYLGEANRGNLYYQTTIGAGHSLVVAKDPHVAGLNDCPDNTGPFIDQCSGYDQAGIILRHVYGALNEPNRGQLSGTVKSFDQSVYTAPRDAGQLSLGDTGYVFVPRECEDGAPCRVHIALHGCEQDTGDVERHFVDDTGYNAWADTNRLIVLYPQAKSKWYPYNPLACWDWWGYADKSDSYVTKSGSQIRTIKAMLDALTARAASASPPAPAPAAAPAALTVIDTSDTGADLAWMPLAGTATYRVWRAGTDGQFAAVGDATGASFADSGLTPRSTYRWRVAAIVNGTEGPSSIAVAAATRPTPAACEHPGSCPIEK